MRDILLAVQRAVDDLSLEGVSTRAHPGGSQMCQALALFPLWFRMNTAPTHPPRPWLILRDPSGLGWSTPEL